MPTGGQIPSGNGIQLQPTYPGSTNNGNGNIDGVMHALRFTTTAPGSDNNASTGEAFGHLLTFTNGAVFPTQGVAVFGVNNSVKGVQADGALIGRYSNLSGNDGCAIGTYCIAGNPSWQPAKAVAIGSHVSANFNSVDDQGGSATGIGQQIDVNCNSVALGDSITVRNGNFVNYDGVGVGRSISMNFGVGPCRSVGLGRGILINKQNILVVGWYNGDQPVTPANSIIIGRPDQNAKVQIGPFDFTNGGAASQRAIVDVNAVVAANDSVLCYTSITAARVVTLPAANSVTAGWKILVYDASGSASGVNTITLTRAGADTINGGTTSVIDTAYGCRELISDGKKSWTVIRSL